MVQQIPGDRLVHVSCIIHCNKCRCLTMFQQRICTGKLWKAKGQRVIAMLFVSGADQLGRLQNAAMHSATSIDGWTMGQSLRGRWVHWRCKPCKALALAFRAAGSSAVLHTSSTRPSLRVACILTEFIQSLSCKLWKDTVESFQNIRSSAVWVLHQPREQLLKFKVSLSQHTQ